MFVPHRFLVRVSHPCRYVKAIPSEDGDELLDLPNNCRIDNFAPLDDKKNFADVRMAWNERGFAFQATVTGKSETLQCDPAKPRFSDGLSLWLDTRGDRNSHRASRYCHQFHLLPLGGGSDREDPVLLQVKINRAQQDAPMADPAQIPFRATMVKRGYRLEVFFPAEALNGFDPDEFSVMGFYYVVRDGELGEQVLSVSSEFPYSDDPSLWGYVDLIKP